MGAELGRVTRARAEEAKALERAAGQPALLGRVREGGGKEGCMGLGRQQS